MTHWTATKYETLFIIMFACQSMQLCCAVCMPVYYIQIQCFNIILLCWHNNLLLKI